MYNRSVKHTSRTYNAVRADFCTALYRDVLTNFRIIADFNAVFDINAFRITHCNTVSHMVFINTFLHNIFSFIKLYSVVYTSDFVIIRNCVTADFLTGT